MRVMLAPLVGSLALSGCMSGDNLVQDASRSAAKSVVTPIIADRFPGKNTAAYSDCVIDNATTDEIVSLARDSVTGVDNGTVQTVVGIASRRGTLECIVKAELGSG